jgi:hydrogenase nickel incorporation protein HypB
VYATMKYAFEELQLNRLYGSILEYNIASQKLYAKCGWKVEGNYRQSVFKNNDEQADKLRRELKEKGVFLLNLMSSPGAGKTTTLKATIAALKDKVKIGVMEADIDSDVDAKRIAETGVKAIQLHTGGMCHLDAEMTRQGLDGLETGDVELAILENVGNLVCPAEFDTGAVKNAMILSVPEGDDKPLKYPLMFSICDVVIINKIDVLPYFDFDVEKCKEYIKHRNPNAKVFMICAKTGEGVDEWANWLLSEVKNWRDEK